jgi:hypothetical protein
MSATPKPVLPHPHSFVKQWPGKNAIACQGLYRPILPVLFGFCVLAVTAQAQVIFQDNLEAGPGNWSVYSYPGAPACTPLSYASTATDPNANHTPGGGYSFQMTHASDREVHDLDPASYGSAGLHLSLWYYDAMKMTYGDFESFDLRTANNSQILGFATRDYSDRPNLYWVRVLSVTGIDPTGGSGYRATTIQRTLGWHHLEIYQYRDPAELNTAEFYVDGALALRETDMVDTTLSRVALGLGWSGNPSQTGYVDDITVQAIPEPGVASLALGGAAAALLLRRAGQRSKGL